MRLIYLLSALLCLNLSVAQNIKTLNKGKVVQKNYNVTVPYKDMNGLVIVQAVIKGKAYDFIVDTGAMSAISQELYDELGLKSDKGLDVDDSSDLRQNMKLVKLPPVQVGDVTFKDVPAVVADNGPFFQCFGIDGFIGSNMMRNSVVKFSYKDKTVSFTDNLKNFNLGNEKPVELLEDKTQSNPYLLISLKNGGITGNEYVLFDTGMTGLYDLSLPKYEKEFKDRALFSITNQAKGAFSVGINGVETQTNHYRLLMPELNFAGLTLENVTLTTTSDDTSRIGSHMLRHGDVIIDYKERKLYFDTYINGTIDSTESNWPIQPVLKEGKFVVGIVWDPGLNDRVNEGDEILKFGEIDFSTMHPCDAFRNNMAPKVSIAVMVLKDKNTGQVKEVGLAKK